MRSDCEFLEVQVLWMGESRASSLLYEMRTGQMTDDEAAAIYDAAMEKLNEDIHSDMGPDEVTHSPKHRIECSCRPKWDWRCPLHGMND